MTDLLFSFSFSEALYVLVSSSFPAKPSSLSQVRCYINKQIYTEIYSYGSKKEAHSLICGHYIGSLCRVLGVKRLLGKRNVCPKNRNE